jgi:hypothetical protein
MRVGMPGSVTMSALAHFLASPDVAREPFNRAHYLREAPEE